MKEVYINCSRLESVDEFHDIMIRELNLPETYGRNMDALYDYLTTDLQEEVVIHLLDPLDLPDNLGRRGDKIIMTMMEAAEENRWLAVSMEEGE